MKTIFFQTKVLKPEYCEIGMIEEENPTHVYYLDEPCKMPIDEIDIIEKDFVGYDKKKKLYYIKDELLVFKKWINKRPELSDWSDEQIIKFYRND